MVQLPPLVCRLFSCSTTPLQPVPEQQIIFSSARSSLVRKVPQLVQQPQLFSILQLIRNFGVSKATLPITSGGGGQGNAIAMMVWPEAFIQAEVAAVKSPPTVPLYSFFLCFPLFLSHNFPSTQRQKHNVVGGETQPETNSNFLRKLCPILIWLIEVRVYVACTSWARQYLRMAARMVARRSKGQNIVPWS